MNHKLNCQCPVCCLKRGEDISKKYPNSCGDPKRFEKWRNEHPKEASLLGTKTMNKLHKERPELFERINKGNSIRMKERHKRKKEEEPEGYYNHFREMSKKADEITPNHCRNGGLIVHKLYPNMCYENAKKSIKTKEENRAYYWNEVPFLSKQEMECAKILLTKPIPGYNCKIEIRSKIIDFFPQKEDKLCIDCFVEYHPCQTYADKRSQEEYYNDRLKIIENSRYKGTKLILISSLKKKEIRKLK